MTETILIRNQRHIVDECITCGVFYTCPEVVFIQQRDGGGYHTCPNGHRQGWDKAGSENAQLLRRAQRAEQEEARLAEEVRLAEQREARAKAETKRVAKRANAGICQCCNRSFANVERHMRLKHPNIVALKSA